MMSTVRPLELAVYAEVFGTDRSGTGGPRFDFAVASERPGVPVTTGGGLQVTPAEGLDRLARADLVAVAPPAGPEARVSVAVTTALRDAVHRGARVMAICSGAYVLAAAGLRTASGSRSPTASCT